MGLISRVSSRTYRCMRRTATIMSNPAKAYIASLKFDNQSAQRLPLDPIEYTSIPRQVPDAIFSKHKPNISLVSPKLVCSSESALKLLTTDSTEIPDSDQCS